MKFLLKVLLIVIGAYLTELFFSWWSIAIVAFIVSFTLSTKASNDFLAGFLGLGLLWLIFAWRIDVQTDGILTDKVVLLFGFNQSALLIALAGLTAGVVGGFSSLSGYYLSKLYKGRRKKGYYYKG